MAQKEAAAALASLLSKAALLSSGALTGKHAATLLAQMADSDNADFNFLFFHIIISAANASFRFFDKLDKMTYFRTILHLILRFF